MPQVSHTGSDTLAYTGVNGVGHLEIPNARNYTKFMIDAVHTNVTAIALEVNLGNGWRSLFTSSMGNTQEVTMTASGANMVELEAPAKGGVRLAITDNLVAAEIKVVVTMTGSLYSEGRRG